MVKDLDHHYQWHDPNDAVESCDGDETRSKNSKDKRPSRKSYPSNVQGRFIVNAVTGIAYPWKVGSYNEEYLWKVADSTHFEPKLYYYDSPEQYEEYKRVRISPEAKFEWHRLQQRIGNASFD